MKSLYKKWLPLIIFIVSLFIFTFKLSFSTSFEGDFGRDLYEIEKITQGNLTLLGPKGSFGGIYTAPYYFYIFAVPYLAFGKSIGAILYSNAFLFACALAFFGYLAIKKYGQLKGILATVTFSMMPFIIFSARNPGNGFSHIPLFVIFLSFVYFLDINRFPWWGIGMVGLLFGVIVSMLFAYAILVIPIFILVFLLLKKKKNFLLFLFGSGAAFAPLMLFEIKNHFVMLKNTFIDKSYLSFMNNTNLPNGTKLSKNIFVNAVDLMGKMNSYFGIWLGVVLLFLILFVWLSKLKKERLFAATSLLGFVILALMLRFQYSFHYLLPFLTLLAFTFLIIVLSNRYANRLLIVTIVTLLLWFPVQYYIPAKRNIALIQSRVEKLLDKNWLSKNDIYNVLLVRNDGAPTPAGNEYRYFLLKAGYIPQAETLYKTSSKLLIFSENKLPPDKIDTWESREYEVDKAKTIKSFSPDKGMRFYFLTK